MPDPAPTPAPADPAPAAPPPPDSLLEQAAAATDPKAAPGADPAAPAPAEKWFLTEGVEGKDKAPEWFKAGKYKTVAEQARAYVDLEKRMGAFTGPPEGDYALSLPEGIEGEFDLEHPIFKEFNAFAREAGLSQDGYTKVMHMLARYEAQAGLVDIQGEMEAIGDNAKGRITHMNDWAKANLSEEQFGLVREALTGRAPLSTVFRAMEHLIAQNRQAQMPRPGDAPPPAAMTLAEVDAMQAKRNERGERLFEVDPEYRRKVRAARAQVVGPGEDIEVVGRKKA